MTFEPSRTNFERRSVFGTMENRSSSSSKMLAPGIGEREAEPMAASFSKSASVTRTLGRAFILAAMGWLLSWVRQAALGGGSSSGSLRAGAAGRLGKAITFG